MQDYKFQIADRIKNARKAKGMKQAVLDERAHLPNTATSKIERGEREATASELVRIGSVLGVSLDSLAIGEDALIYQEEVKIIQALREISFDDFKYILSKLEATVYFEAKDADDVQKEFLAGLVRSLSKMINADQRPRGRFSDNKRNKAN